MSKPFVLSSLLALPLIAAVGAGCGKPDASASAPATSASAAAPAPTGNAFSFSAAPLGATDPEPLIKLTGSVLLIVNTAAHCGYTPQYKPMGEIERKYQARGFHVLGFVSDDFGHQAGTVEEVKACSAENQATFPQFAQVQVKKGPGQHPLFAWLTSQPSFPGDVTWNFNKWLISRTGALIGRWPSPILPDGPEITQAIEQALAN